MMATEIEHYLKQNTEMGFEQGLRYFQERAAKDERIARQFIQLPPYLNHLFGEISENCTRQPREYTNLVDVALTYTDRVLFISLNYETLLEWPLVHIEKTIFADMEDYIKHRKWALLKIHGSCHWYRAIRNLDPDQVNAGHYLDALYGSAYPPDLEKEFISRGIRGHKNWFLGEKVPLYPALTVPIDAKYEMNCPESHLEEGRRLLRESSKVLIVGSSLKDADLLDLLRDHASPGRVTLVGTAGGVADAGQRLADSVPQMPWEKVLKFPGGFAEFVDAGHLERFFTEREQD